jgi:hypothetical protein
VSIQAAFIPHNLAAYPEFELVLLNRTGITLRFEWELKLRGNREAQGTGQVDGEDFAILTRMPVDAFNEHPSITWKIWPEDKSYLPFSREHRLRPSALFKHLRHVKEIDSDAYVLEVAPKLSSKPLEKQPDLTWLDVDSWPDDKEFKASDYKADATRMEDQIDLHIEALVKDHNSLSSPEKLATQLKACDAFLQKALIAGLHHVYLIHGVGSGKLRQVIHKLLAHYPHVKSFSNAYHPKYGFGATEVRF